MDIRPVLIVFSLAIAALSRVAVAADTDVEQARAQKQHAEPEYRAAKSRLYADNKAAQARNAQGRNSYEAEIATIKAQADAAEAACAKQSEENQRACRTTVHADRERAAKAAKRKYGQGSQAR